MAQVRIQIVAPQSFLAAVDDWRRNQTDLPNRSEAIRRLVLERLQTIEPPVSEREVR